jgi:hypothetical protein
VDDGTLDFRKGFLHTPDFAPLSQEHSQQLFVFWGLFHAFLNDFSHYSVSPVFSEIPPHGGIFSSII